jgi:Acetyltransferases, including N-acetylases of ribosomal proteins
MIRLSMPATVETDRLLLQRLRYEDAEEIFYAYASKPEATRYLSWATHQSVDETRTFLKYAVESWDYGTDHSYSIRLKNHVLIGSIGLLNEEGRVQIGYVISPSHWGNGYTTEACGKILSVLQNMKGYYRVGTFVDAENFASMRVLRKCGLVEEAHLPNWFRFVNQDNRPKDCVLFRYFP